MDTDLMQEARRADQNLEIGPADAVVQIPSYHEMRRMRAIHQRRLMGAALRWTVRTGAGLLQSLKASMHATQARFAHRDRPIVQ